MSFSLRAAFDAVADLAPDARQQWYEQAELTAAQIAELEELVAGEAAEVEPPAPLPMAAVLDRDRQLGAYELLEVIGSGGMGTVYRARRSDGRVETEVAIKRSEHILDAQRRARLQLESAMLAKLSHPSIGRFIDAGEDAVGRPYLVMELIAGHALDHWLDARAASLRERVGMVVQLLDALQHAHSRLVLHRDIKSSNVLVEGTGTLKLIDFGIARPLDHAVRTQAYGRFLTLANAAPEQVRGEELGTGVDIYGVGVLLYELLTGAHPFLHGEPSLGELEKRILAGDPRPPSQALVHTTAAPATRGCTSTATWAHALRGDLDAIVLTSLRTEAGARYASCAAFAADLQAWMEARPVQARRGGLLYRVQRFGRRHWLPLTVTTGILVGSLGFAAVLYQRGIELEAARQRAEDERAEAQATSDFLTRLFTESNPRRTASAALSARDLLQRGLENLAREQGLSPWQRMRLLQTVAEAFLGLGDHPAAGRAIALAKDEARKTGVAIDTVLAFRVDSALARDAGDFPGATRALEAALAAAPDTPDRQFNLRLQLAQLRMAAGMTSEALALADTLVAERQTQPGVNERLMATQMQARALDALGRSDEGFERLMQIARLARAGLKADDPALGEFLQDLAGAHYRRGEWAPAAELYAEAERIFSAAFGAESGRAQGARAGAALIALERGETESAIQSLQTLVDQQQDQGRFENVAFNARNLAMALERAGRIDEAWRAINLACDTAATLWPRGHANRVIFLNRRATLSLKRNDPAAAERDFSLALAQIDGLITRGAVKAMPREQQYAQDGLAQIQARQTAPR